MDNSTLLNDLLDSSVDSSTSNTALLVRKDNYRQLVRLGNVTSFSMQKELHTCPRKFQLLKLRADLEGQDEIQGEGNPDFAFGHAVGAGVAEYDKTQDMQAALWATFLAWNIDLFAEGKRKESGRDPKKSFAHAVWAVKLYEAFYVEEGLAEYDMVAVEATIGVDTEDGNFYVGHIDELLQGKETKRLKVKENKTTVFDAVDPALYSNSEQALSYSVVTDAVGSSEYDVFYSIYSSTSQRWIGMPFTKTSLSKAEWLQGQLLLNAELQEYERINFFPKRGSGCITFGRRCEFYESCDFDSSRVFGKKYSELPKATSFEDIEAIEKLDYKFKFSELVVQQQEKLILESGSGNGNSAPQTQNPAGLKQLNSGMETL